MYLNGERMCPIKHPPFQPELLAAWRTGDSVPGCSNGNRIGKARTLQFLFRAHEKNRQCAQDQGLATIQAQPASITHFNHHPKAVCLYYHPSAITWALGCSVHRGVRAMFGRCEWCTQESRTLKIVHTEPLNQTVGYPGHVAMSMENFAS